MRLTALTVLLLGSLAHRLPGADARTIVFFGDSLTAGYGLENPAAEAWVFR